MAIMFREDKYNFLRGELDKLGYNQPLSKESVPLVSVLVTDLSRFKERSSRLKDISQNVLKKNEELESMIGPLQQECDKLTKENNCLHNEILQIKGNYEKHIKGLKCHISDMENAYSDLEFANMELITKIGALEEHILMQHERLLKYEENPSDLTRNRSEIISMKTSISSNKEKNVPYLQNISTINNYLSEVLSHKSPQELTMEIEKLRSERKKLSEYIDFYQNQVLQRNAEIKRLSKKSEKSSLIQSKNTICRCHSLDDGYDDDDVNCTSTKFDINKKISEMDTKLKSCVRCALALVEEVEKLQNLNESEENPKTCSVKQGNFHCICREIMAMKNALNKCKCNNTCGRMITSESSTNIDELHKKVQHLSIVNEELKRTIDELKTSSSNNLLDENKAIKTDLEKLYQELKLLQEENYDLKKSNENLKKSVEDMKKVSKTSVTNKMLKRNGSDSTNSSLVTRKQSTKATQTFINGAISSSKGRECDSNLIQNTQPPSEYSNMKNDIVKEVESLFKDYMSKDTITPDNKQKNNLIEELEKMKAERDYYCKEYHCLQDKVLNSSRSRFSPAPIFGIITAQDYKEPLSTKDLGQPENRKEFKKIQEQERLNEELQNRIKSLTQETIALQQEIHFERCQSKINKIKLDDAIKSLEVEKNSSVSKQQEMISRLHYLESTNSSLNQRLEDLAVDCSSWQTQYNNLRAVNEHLERSLKNAEISLQKSEVELNHLYKQVTLLQQEKNDLLGEISSVNKEVQSAKDKLLMVVKEKDILMEKLDLKTIEIRKLENENSKNKCLMNQLEENISRLNCQLVRHSNEEKRAEKEIMSLKKELKLCMEEKTALINENRALQSDLASLLKDNELKDIENGNCKKEILKLKEQLQNYVEEVRRVEQVLEAKEIEREEMLEQFKTLSAEAMHLENNNQTLESENKWTSDNLRIVEEKLQDLQATVENKDSLVSDMEDQIVELSNELTSLRNELVFFKQENSNLKREAEISKGMIQSLEYSKKKSENDVQSLLEQIEKVSVGANESDFLKGKLTSQIEAQKETINALESVLSSSRKEAIEKSLNNYNVEQKIDELHKTVNQLQDKLTTVNDALLKCQEMCNDYKNENIQLRRELTNEKYEKVKAEETQSFSTSL